MAWATIMRAPKVLLVLLLFACSQPAPRTSAQHNQNSTATRVSFCEFSVGNRLPQTLHPVAIRHVPTEGDERVFYDYSACEGRVPVSIELIGVGVGAIEIRGRGSCFEGVGCVGDTYATAHRRFPTARLYLSRIEGATFSLLVRDGVTLSFDSASIPDSCYDDPRQCDSVIQQSRVAGIYLYEGPEPTP